MAKAWYPVIDYIACEECGTCVQKCPHGVYDLGKAPSPFVLNPDSCIDHCHGCGNRCPYGAITYVGDDTGWTPPNGKSIETESCCAQGCEKSSQKNVLVEYLYLDLASCDRCIGTDQVLDSVMAEITPALKLAGYDVLYHKIEMETAETARQYKFLSSPTIRVNGRDVLNAVKENSCGCCSEISGTEVDCRIFEYNGENYEVPPKEMVAEAILRSVFGPDNYCSCTNGYELPDNLKNFYQGKSDKKACACGCNG